MQICHICTFASSLFALLFFSSLLLFARHLFIVFLFFSSPLIVFSLFSLCFFGSLPWKGGFFVKWTRGILGRKKERWRGQQGVAVSSNSSAFFSNSSNPNPDVQFLCSRASSGHLSSISFEPKTLNLIKDLYPKYPIVHASRSQIYSGSQLAKIGSLHLSVKNTWSVPTLLQAPETFPHWCMVYCMEMMGWWCAQ